jgi:DNA invertase Pin-like site-specific DNA recombinase
VATIGYMRVSTPGQDLELQRQALTAAGAEKLFQDVGTGKRLSRPGLDDAMKYARDGDTLVVWRLDRLARSMKDLLALIERLQAAGVQLRSLHEQIDTGSANGRLILHVFAALSEFEASLLSERTRAGLAAARQQGKVGGRPRALTAQKIAKARALMERGKTVAETALALKVSTRTLQRALADDQTAWNDAHHDIVNYINSVVSGDQDHAGRDQK